MIEGFAQLLGKLMNVAVFMGVLLALLWIIYLVDASLLHGKLKARFGVRPHGSFCLSCIFVSPWLHVDSQHLAGNSIPFFALGSLVMVQGQLPFWLTTVLIILIAGLGIWLLGESGTLHVGASGLILGYLGFTFFRALFAPDLATIIVAVVVGLLYWGLVSQIWPKKEGVSKAGHVFGFLGGVLAAAFITWLPIG